jgi:hypothetical protein
MAVDSLTTTGGWLLAAATGDSSLGATVKRLFGTTPLPTLGCALTFGTGPSQANRLYCVKRSLATLTYDLIDLSGSLLDSFGNVISLTALKLAIVALDAPDGTAKLIVGPQNKTNAVLGPWGSVTDANCNKAVPYWDAVVNEPIAGYPVVNAASDIFPVYNPTAASLDYWLLLAGVG